MLQNNKIIEEIAGRHASAMDFVFTQGINW